MENQCKNCINCKFWGNVNLEIENSMIEFNSDYVLKSPSEQLFDLKEIIEEFNNKKTKECQKISNAYKTAAGVGGWYNKTIFKETDLNYFCNLWEEKTNLIESLKLKFVLWMKLKYPKSKITDYEIPNSELKNKSYYIIQEYSGFNPYRLYQTYKNNKDVEYLINLGINLKYDKELLNEEQFDEIFSKFKLKEKSSSLLNRFNPFD